MKRTDLSDADSLRRPGESPHDWIKRISLARGQPIPELLSMAQNKDPFYKGSDLDHKRAKWFADIWKKIGRPGMHLRAVHYAFLNLKDRAMDDGTPYENTEKTTKHLEKCAILARVLGYVPADELEDHRHPDPHQARWSEDGGVVPGVLTPEVPWFFLPDIWTNFDRLNYATEGPSVTGYGANGFEDHACYVEVWVEKSTMNDILLPVCEEFGATFRPLAGISSITATVNMLKKAARIGKPTRVLYVSDFDPGGSMMPPSAARHIEYWRPKFAPDVEVKLTPLVLTAEQVKTYKLPRIPIKDSDDRREGFEESMGEGAVELDALEGLRPGELDKIMRRALGAYRDDDLAAALGHAEDEAEQAVADEWERQTGVVRRKISKVGKKARTIAKRYEKSLYHLKNNLQKELKPVKAELDKLREELIRNVGEFKVDVPKRPKPAVKEPGNWLFDSSRDYFEQLAEYKKRKSKASASS